MTPREREVPAESAEQPAEAVAEHPVVSRLSSGGSLASQVRQGVAWSAASRGVLVAAQLGAQAVLARLLAPADYGLYALVSLVIGFVAFLSQLGLSTALVQTRRLTDRLLAAAFWLNFATGVVAAAVVAAAAPGVAVVYDDPRLVPLLLAAGLALALNVTAVPSALLQRALRFKLLTGVEVTTTVVGLLATIAFAAAGHGAMSLVLGTLVQVVVHDVAMWAVVRWVPRHLAHRRELAELWRFGRGLTGANLLYYLSRNLDTALLGGAVGRAELGLYSRSYNIMVLPLNQVTTVLSRVLLPAFARMQDDVGRLRRAWLNTARASLVVGLPLGFGVAASAPALVGTLYGEAWLGMVPTLVLLCLSLPPQLVARVIGPAYQALGRTGLQFRLALISTALTVAAILAGLPWGTTGVAAGLLCVSGLSLLVGLVPLMRLLQLSVRELWASLRGILLAGGGLWLAASAAGAAVARVGALPAPAVLGVQVAAGALAYGALLALLEREATASVVARLRAAGDRRAAGHRRARA